MLVTVGDDAAIGADFVADTMKGTCLVNPTHPEMQGTNIMDLKDIHGKPFIREIIAMLQRQASGWLEYIWQQPRETKPSKKVSCGKNVQLGEEMLIAWAGLYRD